MKGKKIEFKANSIVFFCLNRKNFGPGMEWFAII